MTRARRGGVAEEGFGHISRAYVSRFAPGKWDAHPAEAGDLFCQFFPTWGEAMAHALGKDPT